MDGTKKKCGCPYVLIWVYAACLPESVHVCDFSYCWMTHLSFLSTRGTTAEGKRYVVFFALITTKAFAWGSTAREHFFPYFSNILPALFTCRHAQSNTNNSITNYQKTANLCRSFTCILIPMQVHVAHNWLCFIHEWQTFSENKWNK